jgi:HEAT repeat protein
MTAPLVELLDDDEPTVAEEAAFALGESVPDEPGPGTRRAEAVRALSAMARDHADALCRESAVAALGSLGDPAGLDAVLAACGDRATVRRRAVLALAAFEGPRVTEALQALTGDRDLQVRQAAEDLLAIEQGHAT